MTAINPPAKNKASFMFTNSVTGSIHETPAQHGSIWNAYAENGTSIPVAIAHSLIIAVRCVRKQVMYFVSLYRNDDKKRSEGGACAFGMEAEAGMPNRSRRSRIGREKG